MNPLQHWATSMMQANEAMHQAVGNFGMAVDKEVATMAAYRAMGIDPAEAPKFGWMLPDRRGVTQTIINPGGGMKAIILGALGLIFVLAAIYYAMNLPQQNQLMQQKMAEAKQKIAPTSTLQEQICQEFENDPQFREEIENDLAKIAKKILDHRNKRLSN